MHIPARVRSAQGYCPVSRSRGVGRQGALAAASAVVLLTFGVSVSAAAARAPSGPVTETFTYQGEVTQRAVVPSGASSAELRVIGGKGGATATGVSYVTGGDGAQVSGKVPVTPGEVLDIQVAGRGGDQGGPGGWGVTGRGGHGGSSAFGGRYGASAGGGGASGIEIGGHRLVIAGGGGGGGGEGLEAIHQRGGPGGSSGTTVDPGHNGKGAGAGKGGGGAANDSPAGGAGGNSSWGGGGGGGGGAGYVGGGGGSGGGFGSGGGGGGGAGSSYHSPLLTDVSVVRGSTSDENGLIVITWDHVAEPAPMHLTATPDRVVIGHNPVLTVTMPSDATGYVGFYDSALPGADKGIGVARIVDGVATLTTPSRPLEIGTHHVHASYGGTPGTYPPIPTW